MKPRPIAHPPRWSRRKCYGRAPAIITPDMAAIRPVKPVPHAGRN